MFCKKDLILNVMRYFFSLFSVIYLMILPQSVAADNLNAHVPFGGNSWIRHGGQEKVAESGVLNWNSAEATIDTYVRFARSGEIKVYLKADVTGKSKVRIAIAGTARELWMNEGESTFYAGTWTIGKSGYTKIELTGLSKTAEIFAKPQEWVLEGSAVDEHIAFVKDNKDNYFYWGRRGPSVHLNFGVPSDVQTEWFYNEVTVPEKQDVIGSYFMANGFGEGYFGMQVNSSNERRILFSVWSPFKTDDPRSIPKDKQILMLRKGDGVYTGEFGNEGSGGQSYLKYPWKAGNTYRFLLQGKPSGDSTTTYTAFFFAPEEGQWKLIASFKRPKTETYLKRLHSFLENFIPGTGDSRRMVYFGNQWIRNSAGKWTELSRAKFSADATARKGYRMDYAGRVENGQFVLENCGFFEEYTQIGVEFAREPKGKEPQIDFSSLP
jgi:hypothetical protein